MTIDDPIEKRASAPLPIQRFVNGKWVEVRAPNPMSVSREVIMERRKKNKLARIERRRQRKHSK